jgi:hypothetical protein
MEELQLTCALADRNLTRYLTVNIHAPQQAVGAA